MINYIKNLICPKPEIPFGLAVFKDIPGAKVPISPQVTLETVKQAYIHTEEEHSTLGLHEEKLPSDAPSEVFLGTEIVDVTYREADYIGRVRVSGTVKILGSEIKGTRIDVVLGKVSDRFFTRIITVPNSQLPMLKTPNAALEYVIGAVRNLRKTEETRHATVDSQVPTCAVP